MNCQSVPDDERKWAGKAACLVVREPPKKKSKVEELVEPEESMVEMTEAQTAKRFLDWMERKIDITGDDNDVTNAVVRQYLEQLIEENRDLTKRCKQLQNKLDNPVQLPARRIISVIKEWKSSQLYVKYAELKDFLVNLCGDFKLKVNQRVNQLVNLLVNEQYIELESPPDKSASEVVLQRLNQRLHFIRETTYRGRYSNM